MQRDIVLSALIVGGDDASTNFAGVISGSGSFTKTGTGTLTLSGAITAASVDITGIDSRLHVASDGEVEASIIRINNQSQLNVEGSLAVAHDIEMQPRSAFNVTDTISNVAGSITNGGGHVVVRRGSLYVGAEITVQAEDSYDGALHIGDSGHVGALVVTGKNGGNIAVDGGSMEVERDLGFFGTNGEQPYGFLSISNGGRIDVNRHALVSVPLTIELGETGVPPSQPALHVQGQLSVYDDVTGSQSSLKVLTDPAYIPQPGDVFNLFDFGDFVGTFKSPLDLPQLTPALRWNESMLYINGTLSIEALPGDFNQDGTFDAADYVVWRKNDGTPTGYNAWRTNFGQGHSVSFSVADASVPEASAITISLFGWSIFGALMRRCRPSLRSARKRRFDWESIRQH